MDVIYCMNRSALSSIIMYNSSVARQIVLTYVLSQSKEHVIYITKVWRSFGDVHKVLFRSCCLNDLWEIVWPWMCYTAQLLLMLIEHPIRVTLSCRKFLCHVLSGKVHYSYDKMVISLAIEPIVLAAAIWWRTFADCRINLFASVNMLPLIICPIIQSDLLI